MQKVKSRAARLNQAPGTSGPQMQRFLLPMLLLSVHILPGCQSAKDSGTELPNVNTLPVTGFMGDEPPLAGQSSSELLGVVISPTNQVIEMDLGIGESIDYRATAVYADGQEVDVSQEVIWEFQSPNLAAFQGTTLQIDAKDELGTQTALVRARYQELEGYGQVTVVAYQKSGEQPDFFFSLPYREPSEQNTENAELGDLLFQTEVPNLDVFFNMDTTSSMGGFVSVLRDKLSTVIIPGIKEKIPSSWFGVGSYEDFPVSPHGDSTDLPFRLLQEMKPEVDAAQTTVNSIGLNGGADGPESLLEALYQIATGEGLSLANGTELVPSFSSGQGGVGFRENSMRTVFSMTDISMHTIGEDGSANRPYNTDYTAQSVLDVAHDRAETMSALDGLCIKALGAGTDSETFSGLSDVEALAETTGAVVPPQAWGAEGERPANCAVGECCTSHAGGRPPNADGLCPLAYLVTAAGAGLDDSVVDGLEMLTRFSPFDVFTSVDDQVSSSIDGEALPTGLSTADFIKRIEPTTFELPAEPAWLTEPEFDVEQESFLGVNPGTSVSFKIYAKNDFVEPGKFGRFFQTRISVLAGGEGCAELDSREVLILVPPTELEPSVRILR